MTDVNVTIDNIVTEFEQVRKEFQKKAKACMQEAFKEFFKANPRIHSIYWTQYTPYFNDGEECYFGVGDMYAAAGEGWTEDELGEYVEDREHTIGGWRGGPEGYEAENKAFKEFKKSINRLPDEIFKSTFGDHVAVTATRDGFTVEEYDHE